MSTNKAINVNDGASVAPATSRRLFEVERVWEPTVSVDRKGNRLPRVVLQLPDNGSDRAGPGTFVTGNITKIIHARGCDFTVTPCDGKCVAPKELTP